MISHTKSRMTPQGPLWVDAIVLCFVYFVRLGSNSDRMRRSISSPFCSTPDITLHRMFQSPNCCTDQDKRADLKGVIDGVKSNVTQDERRHCNEARPSERVIRFRKVAYHQRTRYLAYGEAGGH